MSDLVKTREEKEKEQVLNLLREQLKVEEELIRYYKETAAEAKNLPLQYMLNMIQRDEMKHLEICQIAIAILQGEDLLTPEKEELREILQPHHDLEEESIDRTNKILKNTWIKQNQGLTDLIKKIRDDEQRHHNAIENVLQKPFFRLDPTDIIAVLRELDFLEERYIRSRDWKRRKEELEEH